MSKTLQVSHTTVFTQNWDCLNDNDLRFIINQGGSRSSKTYSIMQMIIVYCLTNPKIVISVVRKSFPALRASVLRDFTEVMKELDIYKVSCHNKTENIYTFPNGSVIEFFSVDDEQKLRGRKRHILWANEANELSFDEFNQLNMRTSDKLIFDFNPSDNEHWLYDLIIREDCKLIKSTYKDNPFLADDIVKEIENLIAVDHNYYLIYALGERPIPSTRIYTHFNSYVEDPIDCDIIYGCDFGFTHQTALVKIRIVEDNYYCEEILYKSFLTSSDTINEFNQLDVSKTAYIYADYARPEIITDLRRAGYNIKEANKSVIDGINSVKSNKIWYKNTSLNLLKEYKMYSWKTKGEEILEEPIKLYDHIMDAIRYGIHSYKKKKFNPQASNIFIPKVRSFNIDDDDITDRTNLNW